MISRLLAVLRSCLGLKSISDLWTGFIGQLPKPQSPSREIGERVADGWGLQTAAQAVGLEQHRQMLHDHRNRVADSHRMGAAAMGMQHLLGENRGAEDMGDINVTGDQYHQHVRQGGSLLWPAIAGAAIALGAWWLYNRPQPAPVQSQTEYDVEVDMRVVPPPE